MTDENVVTPSSTLERSEAVRRSAGFTLVELLITIVIVGILATVTVFAVRGITDRGEEASCQTDERVLTVAVESYFSSEQVSVLPSSGAGANRYERGLVDAGFLRTASTFHDLAEDGTITSTGAPCP